MVTALRTLQVYTYIPLLGNNDIYIGNREGSGYFGKEGSQLDSSENRDARTFFAIFSQFYTRK